MNAEDFISLLGQRRNRYLKTLDEIGFSQLDAIPISTMVARHHEAEILRAKILELQDIMHISELITHKEKNK